MLDETVGLYRLRSNKGRIRVKGAPLVSGNNLGKIVYMFVKDAPILTSEIWKKLHVQLSKLPYSKPYFGAVKYFNQSENHSVYNLRLCPHYVLVDCMLR